MFYNVQLKFFQLKNIIITAGAGMGVDSGLPDFQGTKGFGGHIHH